MRKWAYDGAPLLLALVLGPEAGGGFPQSLMISRGDFGIFVDRPISMVFLIATVIFLVFPLMKSIWKAGTKKGVDRTREGRSE